MFSTWNNARSIFNLDFIIRMYAMRDGRDDRFYIVTRENTYPVSQEEYAMIYNILLQENKVIEFKRKHE